MRNCLLCFWVVCCFCICSGSTNAFSQEEQENIENANTYLDHRIDALQKSLDKTGDLQQQLLKRLKRKEDKMLRKLAKQDSTLYKQYVEQHLNYDSIAAISNDTSKHPQSLGHNRMIDSLKNIQQFVQNQTSKLGSISGLSQSGTGASGTQNLNDLQQKLNTQSLTDQLIQKHTTDLKQLAGASNINGLLSIQKDVFYTKEKIKSYREMADDPDAAEAKALEALQGSETFGKFLNPDKSTAFGGLGGNASEADLQSLGFQTKSQMNGMLQSALGDNLGKVQQQMSDQISQYSDKLNNLKAQVDAAKKDIAQTKETINEVKADAVNAKTNLKKIEKPDFKINKEKGKPFWKRIEKSYNVQSSRASADELRPAMLILGANAGYKETEKLSFGIGIALNIGLGQNWQHLNLSYEGVTARAYIDRICIYGFSFQAGYERAFIPQSKLYLIDNPNLTNNPTPPSDNPFKEALGSQLQTAYLGMMKRYKINAKVNGTFLVGYNFLWQTGSGESRSPWLLRFGWAM